MKQEPSVDTFYFRKGIFAQNGIVTLLCRSYELAEEDVEHTFVFQRNEQGEWAILSVEWEAIGICWLEESCQLLLVGENGESLAAQPGGTRISSQIVPDLGSIGPFTNLQKVGRSAFAVGMGGIIYRFDISIGWTKTSSLIPSSVDFEAVDGFSDNEIYAVGWKGAIWRFDGSKWSCVDVPTNLHLTSVVCADDGWVYVCGQHGILLRGRESTWQVVEQDDTEEDLWSIKKYKDSVYVATTDYLYTIEKDSLVEVNFDEDFPRSCYHIQADERNMLSVGQKDVFLLTDNIWERVL